MTTKITGFDRQHFNSDLETVAYVTVTIPVNLIFDEMPTQEELIRDAFANFAHHPILTEDQPLDIDYVDSIVLENPTPLIAN